ncbi:Chloroperoxidase [Trametes elegans]|nr:Chloroperoxidase [Trametes elegans]
MSTPIFTHDDSAHPYCPAKPGDSRAPCPALNTLANHSYLPHDGRNLTPQQLTDAVKKVYGLSPFFAYLLAHGGVARAGAGGKLDLHDLAAHNVIEHDGSLVHADARPGDKYAPTDVDRALLRQLLDRAPASDFLSYRDLTEAQVARHAVSAPRDALSTALSKGELELIFEVFGVRRCPAADGTPGALEGRVVPKAWLEQWLGEERIPDGWPGPSHQTGFVQTVGGILTISKTENEEKQAGPQPPLSDPIVPAAAL